MPDTGEQVAKDVNGLEFRMDNHPQQFDITRSTRTGAVTILIPTDMLTPTCITTGVGLNGGSGGDCTPTSSATDSGLHTFPDSEQTNAIDKNTPPGASVSTTPPSKPETRIGTIVGVAVGMALLALLIGLGILLFIRKKRRKSQGVDNSEQGMMMAEGKQVDGDDGSGSGVLHAPGSQQAIASGPGTYQQQPLPPSSPPPPATSPAQLSYHLVDNPGPSSSTHYPAESSVVASALIDPDLIDRPVSPPLPDDAPDSETHVANPHASSRDVAGTSLSGDVRGNLEEDPEMQWILEEERRAKERKEQQEELRRLT